MTNSHISKLIASNQAAKAKLEAAKLHLAETEQALEDALAHLQLEIEQAQLDREHNELGYNEVGMWIM